VRCWLEFLLVWIQCQSFHSSPLIFRSLPDKPMNRDELRICHSIHQW
jgi:hypothetical protein